MFVCIVFFFFKQKTAYELRISDWSSDVCSSDLRIHRVARVAPVYVDESFRMPCGQRRISGAIVAVYGYPTPPGDKTRNNIWRRRPTTAGQLKEWKSSV